MDVSGRWLVCGGPMEFIETATVLLGSDGATGIEWEPLPARACVRAASSDRTGGMGVVVTDGVFSGSPVEVACAIAALGCGLCILSIRGAATVAAAVAERGVTAAVEPRALPSLLEQIRQGDGSFLPPAPGEGWDGDPLPDELLDEMAQAFTGQEPESDRPIQSLVPFIAPIGAGDRGDSAHLPEPRAEVDPTDRAKSLAGIVVGHAEASGATLPMLLPSDMDARHVPTVCFASARGGVGKSALAALSALALAREGLNVALIDLDYQFGTCLGYLGADETDGLIDPDCFQVGPLRLDGRTLARCRVQVCPGVVGYEFCRAPEQAEILSANSGLILEAARQGFDVAIVDLPSGVNEVAAQAFELSDRCLLVGDHRALSLESLGLQQALCVRIGVPRTKLVTVLNRCDPRHRDESFLARAPFELQTPQIARVADGGGEVMQMLAIGGAAELISIRNRFALSTSDLIKAVCTDLGCLHSGEELSRPALPPPAGSDRDGASSNRRARKVRQRKEKKCRS